MQTLFKHIRRSTVKTEADLDDIGFCLHRLGFSSLEGQYLTMMYAPPMLCSLYQTINALVMTKL